MRFKEEEDVILLVVKLYNVIFDRKKIHANLPIFERFRGKDAGFRGKGQGVRVQASVS